MVKIYLFFRNFYTALTYDVMQANSIIIWLIKNLL